METSDVRRRIREAIARGKRQAAERRVRNAEATQAFERFLTSFGEPLFRQVAGALKSEGYPFAVYTPASAVRLASEHSPADFVELRLDTAGTVPQVVLRIERVKGRETVLEDRPLKPGTLVEHLTDQDVLESMAEVLPIFIER